MLSALILYHLAENVRLQAVRLEVRRGGAFSSSESSIVHFDGGDLVFCSETFEFCTGCWRFTLYAPILPV